MRLRLERWILGAALLAAPAAAQPEAGRATANVDSRALQRGADAFAAWVGTHGGRLGVVFVDAESGAVLASSGADLALNPASNAKLFTAAAALSQLGPGYRFTTAVHGRIEDGVAARLVLRGHGDPSLGSGDLASLARELAALGLRRVTGDLVVDQSRFDDRFVPPAFDQQPNEWAAFRAPVSAIAVDRNAVTVHVLAIQAGKPARVWVEPPGAAELAADVVTAPAGAGRKLQLSIVASQGRLRAELRGKITQGLPRVSLSRRVDDPRRLPGQVLAHFLRKEGIQIDGSVVAGTANEPELLASHQSEPLSSLLHELGKRSDNFYAEMLLKAIGAETTAAAGTSAAGATAVTEWLRSAGALEPSTRIVNGSGLFDANRASATTLTRALVAAYADPAISSEMVAQLAIGGVDGTLRSRFRGRAKTRAIRAKTGTLARVVALSGYVLRPSRAPIAFAMMVEGAERHRPELRKRMDSLVESALP